MTATTVEKRTDARTVPTDRPEKPPAGSSIPYRALLLLALLVAAVATVGWRYSATPAEGPASKGTAKGKISGSRPGVRP